MLAASCAVKRPTDEANAAMTGWFRSLAPICKPDPPPAGNLAAPWAFAKPEMTKFGGEAVRPPRML